MVPGIAWVADKRPLPALRWLAAVIGVLVLARIGWEPRIVGDDVGTTPIFNWLLYGYGIPAAAFWLGGYLLRRRGDDAPARMIDSGAILLTVLLAFLEIRHFINGGDVYRASASLAEVALQVCVGLAMTIGLERLRLRTNSIVHDVGALIIAALTLGRHRVRARYRRESAGHGRAGRRPLRQPDPARIRPAGSADGRTRARHPRRTAAGRTAPPRQWRRWRSRWLISRSKCGRSSTARCSPPAPPAMPSNTPIRRSGLPSASTAARGRMCCARRRCGSPRPPWSSSPSSRSSSSTCAVSTGIYQGLSFIGLGIVLLGDRLALPAPAVPTRCTCIAELSATRAAGNFGIVPPRAGILPFTKSFPASPATACPPPPYQ